MLWFGGSMTIWLAVTLPEVSTRSLYEICLPRWLTLNQTNSDNILLRRAKRLRAKTGKESLSSQGEIDQSRMSIRNLLSETLKRPLKITVTEPIAIALNLYPVRLDKPVTLQ